MVPDYKVHYSQVEEGRKPGIATIYRDHIDVLARTEVVMGRLQFVDFGTIKICTHIVDKTVWLRGWSFS